MSNDTLAVFWGSLIVLAVFFAVFSAWLSLNKERIRFWWGFQENKRSRPRNSFLSSLITQPDNSRVWGFDISGRWDGLVDFVVAKSRGASFVIIKCTEGTVNTPLFIENITAALKEGLVSGAYHWLHRNAVVSCKAQANAAWNRIKAFPKILPLVIDLEATKWNGLPSNPNYTDAELFADEIIRLSGRKPILYSSPSYLQMLGPLPASLARKLEGIHIANYGVTKPNYPTWIFWQFSPEGDALYLAPGTLDKKELDLNYWHGSLSGLYELAGLISPDPTPIPPSEETIMDTWQATWDAGLNKRPAANVNNTPVGVIPDNTTFTVTGYFIPLGKTQEQEYWGLLDDGYWVALVYNSQPRAVRVDPQPAPADSIRVKEVRLTIVLNGVEYVTTIPADSVLEAVG